MQIRPAIVALLYSLMGLMFVGIGVPLALRRVKPNAWYGFRTAKTFSDPRIWYAANRVAGIDLIIGGIAMIVCSISLLLVRVYLKPTLPTEAWCLLAFIATIIVVACHGFWALSRL